MNLLNDFRIIKIILPLTCFALLCTGCFKFNVGFTIENDGSGTFAGEFAISRQLGETFSEESEDLTCEEIFESTSDETDLGPLSDLPSGSEVVNFEDDEWCGYTFTAPFNDFGRSIIEAGDESFPIIEADGILEFSFPLDDLGSDVEGFDTGEDDIEPSLLLQAFGIPAPEFIITVDFPGKIIEHNADSLNGSTLTWELDFFDPRPDFAPYAKADLNQVSGGTPIGTPVFVLIGAVAVFVILLSVLRGRSQHEEMDTNL